MKIRVSLNFLSKRDRKSMEKTSSMKRRELIYGSELKNNLKIFSLEFFFSPPPSHS